MKGGVIPLRRARAFWLALFLTLAAVPVVTAQPASARICGDLTLEEAAERADLVADATVRERIIRPSHYLVYDVVVHTIWKGEQRRQIVLTTTPISTCGLGRLSGEMRLYAVDADGEYAMSSCSRPWNEGDPATHPVRLSELLGEPADLTGEPVSPRRSWVIAGVSVPAVALATGLISWLAQRGRRPRAR